MAIHHNPDYEGYENYPFPNDNIPVKEKDKYWHLKVAKAIYSYYVSGQCAIKPADIDWINTLRQYAAGKQSIDQYRDIFFKEDVENVDEFGNKHAETVRRGYMNISWQNPVTPTPTILRTAIGILLNVENDTLISAYDERTANAKTKKKAELKVKRQFSDLFKNAQAAGIYNPPENEIVPETNDELNVLEDMGHFKLTEEVAYEKKVIPFTYDQSKYPIQKYSELRDLFIHNMAAKGEYWDYSESIYKLRYYDFADLIIQNMPGLDYENAAYEAIPITMTVKDIRDELDKYGVDYTEEELYNTAKGFRNQYGNPQADKWEEYKGFVESENRYKYDAFTMPVLHSYFKSNDLYGTGKYVKTKNGAEIPEENVRNNELKSGKIKQQYSSNLVIRQCKWIVGSEIVWDHGIMPNSYSKSRLPIQLIKLEGKSVIEQMIGHADNVALNDYRFRNNIALMAPNGMAINISAMNDLTIGGTVIDGYEAMKIRSHSGITFYNDPSIFGNQYGQARMPFTPTEGGMGRALDEHLKIHMSEVAKMAELSGITMNQLQNSNVTATAVSSADIMMNHNLKPIYMAYVHLKKMVVDNIINRVHRLLSVEKKENTGYDAILSDEEYRAINESGQHSQIGNKTITCLLGCAIIDKPSDKEIQAFMQALQQAMQIGRDGMALITPSEYTYLFMNINNGNGLKYGQRYLMMREAKREKENQANKQAAIAAQGQQIQQQIETKVQGELATDKAHMDLEKRNKESLEAMKQEFEKFIKGFEHGMNLSQNQQNLQQQPVI